MRIDYETHTLMDAIHLILGVERGGSCFMVQELYNITRQSEKIDPMSFLNVWAVPSELDGMQIYGADIETLWANVCARNFVLIHVLLRAKQLGFIRADSIRQAIAECSDGPKPLFEFKKLYEDIKERLGNFDPENTLDVASIGKLFNATEDVKPNSPARATARWWANTLRGAGKSYAGLDDLGEPVMALMSMLLGIKKVDSEEQVQKFEDALTELIEKELTEGIWPVYNNEGRSRFEPRTKKKRILKKFYKKEYEKYGINRMGIRPTTIPDERKMIVAYYKRPVRFGVDYHPDRILEQACAEAGIKCGMLTFPAKTHCTTERTWAGVANGYGAGMEIIFGEAPKRRA